MNIDLSKANFLTGSNVLTEYDSRYKEDLFVIQKALVKHGFVNAGLQDASWLWSEYSDSRAAGWLGGAHPNDVEYYDSEDEFLDDVFRCVQPFIKKYVYPAD